MWKYSEKIILKMYLLLSIKWFGWMNPELLIQFHKGSSQMLGDLLIVNLYLDN